ncbi:MAG: DUF6288 domain-containing protein [Akkermansiaceae bacterium]
MKYSFFKILTAFLVVTGSALADERTLTPEQMEAIANQGALTGEENQRPAKLPDLTKGDPLPEVKKGHVVWTLGPTGVAGIMSGKHKGDQIQVQATLKGSPAEGKFLPGDVIIGMNGKKFVAGGHLGILIGNAIIEAEREKNGGKISFLVWRDKNYVKRFGKKDVVSVDIDKLFKKARDDNSLYEWKPEEERTKEAQGFGEFPIDPTTLEISLTIRTFPEYSDTAPWDCPKTEQILEEAWKVLEKKFVVDPKVRRSGRGGIVEAIALIASGKPEHRELVKNWVRSPNAKQWHPSKFSPGDMFKPGIRDGGGKRSWYHGYTGLYCAIYYDATGDEFVLPAMRKFAIDTALGQSGGGTWGHTFAMPSFNGGEFHKMNPGYGALNAAGNRCFFLITLAQKLGVEHPALDAAVKRSHRFFSSYVDQGCIPYGDHPAYASDDSNGKNTGVAFSMKLLGDKYGAKYFAQMSSHCAFTRRGGHGHDYHGNWSSWAATLCGKEVRIMNERNLRWRRTLCRMFDGSFVYHSPTVGQYGALRDPTATEVLHQAVIHKQTIITGKDLDEDLFFTDEEIDQLLASARGQFNDPMLIERAGKPWKERSTDEVFKLLNIFYPKARRYVAQELGKRYVAGEKEILGRLVKLLESDDARMREGACKAIAACGRDIVLENLSKIVKLLDDPKDFVRITAVNVISKNTDDKETQLAILKATVAEPKSVAPNSVRNASQTALFAKATKLGEKPFEAGFDEELVRQAIEDVLTLDPVGGRGFVTSRIKIWDKDTVLKIAGPLTFAAEEEQIVEQMFANRCEPAQGMLGKFGYREAVEATAHRLRKKAAIPRHIRPHVGYKRTLLDPDTVTKQPGAFHDFIEHMGIVLTDNPLEQVMKLEGDKKVYLDMIKFYDLVKATKKPVTLPSIAPDVQKMFMAKLDALDGTGAKMKLCRYELKDPSRKNYFRAMAAMDFLNETLGEDALEDLVPYLGHSYWRLRDHSQKIAVELVSVGGDEPLAALFSQTTNPASAAGILDVFAKAKSTAGLPIAKAAMKHKEPVVRQAAVKAYFALGGDKVLPEILAHMKESTTEEDLRGCEQALLFRRDDAAHMERVREGVVGMLSGASDIVRPSLYYLLAQIGDSESIAALEKAAGTDSVAELGKIIFALSYSQGRAADDLMLKLAKLDKQTARVVANESVRRMVLGPKGFGDITNAQRLDFAEPMLKLHLDTRLIGFLANVHEARALRTLMYCLAKGVESAADSLVANAEGMKNLSPKDSKIAAKAIRDVIEYIEVTRLRGGPTARMKKEDKYYEWKALQARAGKVLLKIHKPETAPIPEFDPLDLDP